MAIMSFEMIYVFALLLIGNFYKILLSQTNINEWLLCTEMWTLGVDLQSKHKPKPQA